MSTTFSAWLTHSSEEDFESFVRTRRDLLQPESPTLGALAAAASSRIGVSRGIEALTADQLDLFIDLATAARTGPDIDLEALSSSASARPGSAQPDSAPARTDRSRPGPSPPRRISLVCATSVSRGRRRRRARGASSPRRSPCCPPRRPSRRAPDPGMSLPTASMRVRRRFRRRSSTTANRRPSPR